MSNYSFDFKRSRWFSDFHLISSQDEKHHSDPFDSSQTSLRSHRRLQFLSYASIFPFE